MTRKDYEAIAAALRASAPSLPLGQEMSQDQAAVYHGRRFQHRASSRFVADVLEKNNPRFDRGRFLKACGVEV